MCTMPCITHHSREASSLSLISRYFKPTYLIFQPLLGCQGSIDQRNSFKVRSSLCPPVTLCSSLLILLCLPACTYCTSSKLCSPLSLCDLNLYCYSVHAISSSLASSKKITHAWPLAKTHNPRSALHCTLVSFNEVN